MLAQYLHRYTTALKKTRFCKIYIDAFAGTGYREEREAISKRVMMFPELAADEPTRFRDGSARIALQTQPPFDAFVFVERSKRRSGELAALKDEFPEKATAIEIRQGDANKELQTVCAKTDWRKCRAVTFLDPYGMQVDWKTIEMIAATRAIDVWILFPVGMGVNRMLTGSLEEMPLAWRTRLTRFFGSTEWERVFYRREQMASLFAATLDSRHVRAADMDSIARYYHSRLKLIFTRVAENPSYLRNSTNSPLYQMHFAAGNLRGAPIAMNIAQHILNHT